MAFYENYANICKSLGLSPSTIAKEVAGKNSHADWKNRDIIPTTETIIKLVNRLHCSADKLLFGKDPELLPKHKQIIDIYEQLSPEFKDMSVKMFETFLQVQIERENKYKIDKIDKTETIIVQHSIYKVSAGMGYNLEDEGDTEDLVVVKTPEAEKATLAITIEGDSMSPMYEDGDIVFVKLQKEINIGQIGIFTINNGKGYIKKKGSDRLISVNPKYEDIMFEGDKEILCTGLVLGKATLLDD